MLQSRTAPRTGVHVSGFVFPHECTVDISKLIIVVLGVDINTLPFGEKDLVGYEFPCSASGVIILLSTTIVCYVAVCSFRVYTQIC